jgi:hypothetical protein
MVTHFAFEVEPIAVRKEYSKCNDLSDQYLAHGIEVTAAFGEVGDASGMSFFAAIPHRIKMNA